MQNWNELDEMAVKISRALAMDAVQKVGNGHPGTAVALAPVAYRLFQNYLKHSPTSPNWLGRDRFVLSAGHSSLTLYIQLFLTGYGLEIEDLKSFRTLGSLTPGHPEYGHTDGVEITTGPLGSGISSAVGMAMASRYEKGLFDPKGETNLFDHNIWVIASDGDLQEGISSESSSLAGTQALGNLKVIYDDNRISIEGDTHLSFTEDVSSRYRAYGWHVIEVPTKPDGDVDLEACDRAMQEAIQVADKPTLIRLHSVIAWPAPKARNTSESHGAALGDEEIAATKKILGLDPDVSFFIDAAVLAHTRAAQKRGLALEEDWNSQLSKWREGNAERAALLDRLLNKKLPQDWEKALPVFGNEKDISTRAASGQVINAIAKQLPEFWGGSADLAGSNNTNISNGGSFLPETSAMPSANPFGRTIHFGIREHAMGAILNGITLHGLTKTFGGTFLVFSDYMRGSVRLAALMDLPVTYVWSHDSIGVGEDGPTHQPVEHFAALRAIPNLHVIRPADANETALCWLEILKRNKPAGILLSRQNLPVLPANAEGVAKGAYAVKAVANPKISIIATGSEVSVALKAAQKLEADGISTQVVSAPCLEWFAEQPKEYREKLLPESALKVSIEAGIAQGWREFVGDNGVIISLDHFGASAAAGKLFEEFGFGADAVVSKIKAGL